jgi:hypothetical protein
MSGSHSSHLSQRQITEIDGIDDIIENLKGWLGRAEFREGKKKGEEYCAAKDLPHAALPLFKALGFREV